MSVAVAVFTRDLRVRDNPTLAAACRGADQVVPVFVLDPAILDTGLGSPNRAQFLAESLADLDAGLRARGGRLVLRAGDTAEQVARLAAEVGAAQAHIAADVSGYALRRETALRRRLDRDGRALLTHATSVTIVEPGTITPAGRDHFAVFTPYLRRWDAAPKREPAAAPSRLSVPTVGTLALPNAQDLCAGPRSPRLPPGGERAGSRALRRWVAGPVARYLDAHDLLAQDGTSRLSPYLRFGCVSPIQALHAVDAGSPGGAAFIRQLVWRDFHHQVLAARPDAARRDYRARRTRWRRDESLARAWRAGQTGYPIVDAAMRQLQAEGWMHNRGRLITASFLTKTLLLDWRVGASHFQRLLVDADVADNQLNWQWVAGTGTDTRPNRVLNPLRQAERYDPDGDYVRRWVPELAGLSAPAIHRPWTLDEADRARLGYADPVVEPAEALNASRRHRV